MPLYTGTSGMLPAMLRLFRFQIQGFAVPFVVLVNEHNRIVLSWAGLHQPAVPVVYCKVSFHAGPDSDSLALLKEVELGEEPFVSSGAVPSCANKRPHNVCLDFPQVGKQLWTTEAFLVASSPYFKDLLSSDFAEGLSSISEVSSAPGEDASYPFDDSDAETDAAEVVEGSKQAVHTPLAPFKRVVITESCYTTYSAVLLWLQTGHISFAPLRSASRLEQGPASAATEGPLLSTRLQAGSRSPLALALASPKSVYRLADYLSLDALKYVALANLVSQLTPANAAHELFSDVSSAYADMRDAVLDYVVEHWSEVKGAAGTQEVQERALRGELPPAAAGTSLLLARRLGEELGA
ncbi:hypothetical protein DMC30DRAFT_413634 [Rhodotorula diobovata]|uniref:BTB domain-containing protein n=1 Tax=Rhodotorula diobovata TaxID=5288 RepID=A0A5C5G467_9BASI|nr:hypothetical protein DMC30DRAFT_413634 [Rhodotorula diobovata]